VKNARIVRISFSKKPEKVSPVSGCYGLLKYFLYIMLFMTQTKISKKFQTTISAEAIRMLSLRPGQHMNQIVEGKRLILEPVEDGDALAGSLGRDQGSRKKGHHKGGSGGIGEEQVNGCRDCN
jgi:bifunctional DNA-binding transcriptional regulator/antitoxin component of YhaV-PrlF toxin-antitoxin module